MKPPTNQPSRQWRNRGLGQGLTPEAFRGRTVERDAFLGGVYKAFADLYEPEDEDERERLMTARAHLLPFIQEMMPTYRADPFHKQLAGYLEKVVDGEVKALMVTAPPQHGKSIQVSQMLPPFWLAHHPDLPVLLTSYAASRAHDNSRRARSVAMSPMYARLFGGRTPDWQNWRAFHWAFEGLPGYVYAAGLGGPVTGMGFGIGIIDDPHESWATAQSETIRRHAWEWYQGTFLGRLWENAPIVFITTRWNEDDLAGRILAEEGTVEEGGRWIRLNYPALAEAEDKELGIGKDLLGRKPGEPLAPSRFSREYLLAMQQRVGPLVWSAEYQQHPSRPQGDLFKIGRIEIKEVPPADLCRIVNGAPVEVKKGVRRWDLAATAESRAKRDPDFTSGTLMAEEGKRGIFWWLDQITERLDPEQVEDIIIQTAKVDGKGVRIRIEQEPGASGKFLGDYFVKALAGYDVEVQPKSGSKMVAAMPLAAQVNAGNVVMLKAPWNKGTLAELAAFPNAAHDDQVDSGSGAFNDITKERGKFRETKFAKI